jgi:hypothetical protein
MINTIRLAVGLLAMLSTLAVAPGRAHADQAGKDETVKCESIHVKPAECPVGRNSGVSLIKQLSRDACIEGKTWGYDNSKIWVKDGCRGKFLVKRN